MLKTKQRRSALVALIVFSMMAMYGGMPAVNAASMDSAKVTLSDSDLSALGTVTIVYNLGTGLIEGEYINVNFETGFTTIDNANATCPANSTPSGSGQNVTCTVDEGQTMSSTTDLTFSITGVTNPADPGDYSVTISSHHFGGNEIETTETKVYIIDDVTVTAHVAASLTFAVAGIATTTAINGDETTGSTTAQEIEFGNLPLLTEQRMGQELRVSTNARSGFSVTVQQDHNMLSGGGADIDPYVTGTPTDWAHPTPVLGSDETYGYMGLASNDSNLPTSFAAGFYQGLTGTTPLEVLRHTGPADGSTQDAGLASVMYNIEISALQEAGDYSNTLTYVCTPIF